ncbi:MAG: DOMON domain-containing protein [Treponemataceae bacterium]
MNRFARFIIVFTLIAFVALSAIAQNAPVVIEKSGITVSVLIQGPNAEITVSAEAKGWVAVGFNPTKKMKDADFLIGYVKNGVAYASDDFGTGSGSHAPDEKIGGKNTLISFSGEEKGGRTTITFVVPVDSGDSKDAKLTPGKHTIIVGASNSDSFTGMHNKVGKTFIVLP